MATFIEHDPEEHKHELSLQHLNLESLAEAGNGSNDEDTFAEEANFPPFMPAPSPATRERKATVKRRSPRHLPGMSFFTASTSVGGGGRDEPAPSDLSVHSHTRRAEISAEVFTGKKATPYRKTIVDKDPATRQLIRTAVDGCMLFADLDDHGKDEVVDAFSKITAFRGQLLIEEGEWGDLFYVLLSGTCDALKMVFKPALNDRVPNKVKSYGPGGSFGELALMYNEPRAATIRVTSDQAELWVIDRLSYKNISVHFKVQRQKAYEEALRRVQPLYNLPSEEMVRVLDVVEEREVVAGQTIIKLGDATDEALVLLSGGLVYATGRETGQASVGDVFNDAALFKQERSAFALRTGEDQTAVLLVITRQRVEEILGPLANRNTRDPRPKSVMVPRQQANHRHHIAMRFEDLDTNMRVVKDGASAGVAQAQAQAAAAAAAGKKDSGVRPPTPPGKPAGGSAAHDAKAVMAKELVLGVGTFGKVIICKHVTTGETYAMKKLIKSWIVENCLEQHVVDERNVMTLTDHPFILKLHSSFWDEYYVYLVLELCLGGELFSYLRKYDRFNEQQARFYAASIVQAFEHLHSKSIVYRDLKPENLMLDDKGYLKVVDFGLAKVVKGRTWTICGTPEYLAPEVVLSKGHNRGVDYWALGILIFEMVAGECPFTGDDNMVIYRQIVENKISFPPLMTPDCRDIVRDFTKVSQLARLGLRRPGIKAIRESPWFLAFDWPQLDALKLPPPIVPKVRNRLDTSNFEEYESGGPELAPELCAWTPLFPYEVRDGKTDLLYKQRSTRELAISGAG